MTISTWVLLTALALVILLVAEYRQFRLLIYVSKPIAIPLVSADGGSAVIDYRGTVLAEAAQGESMVAHALIDLEALR